MSNKRRTHIRKDLAKNLRDYKGFGLLKNGMLRKGFTRLCNGKVVRDKDLI